jgi:predicted GNAT superfamily acetyltransferase
MLGLAEEADRCAQGAANRYGVRVAEAHSVDEHHAIARLLGRVWHTEASNEIIDPGTVRALSHSGNYVVSAYSGDRLVGAAVAFFGAGHLHSHITGVDPAWQGGGVGYAVKMHQRAWALARGVDDVRWTFDPLVRRNAYFNLHKLGATVTEYLTAFYGDMTDGINAGDATDRLYVSWRLASPRALAAAAGDRADVVRRADAAVLVDQVGQPAATVPPTDKRPVLVAVPPDIEAVRGQDRALAARWRFAVREAMTGALDAGYRIRGISRDGYYLLTTLDDGA